MHEIETHEHYKHLDPAAKFLPQMRELGIKRRCLPSSVPTFVRWKAGYEHDEQELLSSLLQITSSSTTPAMTRCWRSEQLEEVRVCVCVGEEIYCMSLRASVN